MYHNFFPLPMLHVLPLKVVISIANLFLELGVHIKAIGNVINDSFYAVCHLFGT